MKATIFKFDNGTNTYEPLVVVGSNLEVQVVDQEHGSEYAEYFHEFVRESFHRNDYPIDVYKDLKDAFSGGYYMVAIEEENGI